MRHGSSFAGRWMRRLFWTTLLGTTAVIVAGWLLIPRLSKTPWGRSQFEAFLSSAAGGPVKMDSFEVSWSEGVTAGNLRSERISRPSQDLSLSVRKIQLRPKAKDLWGRAASVSADVDEPRITILEKIAGPEKAGSAPTGTRWAVVREWNVESLVIRNGTLTYDSEAFNSPVILEKLSLQADFTASDAGTLVFLREFTGTLNGGEVRATGKLNLEPGDSSCELEIEGTDVGVNDLVARAIRHLVPLFETLAPGSASGAMDFSFKAQGRAAAPEALWSATTGAGNLEFRGSLNRIRILDEILRAGGVEGGSSVPMNRMTSRLRLSDGRIHNVSADFENESGGLHVTGWIQPNGAQDLLVSFEGRPFPVLDPIAARWLESASDNGGIRVLGTITAPTIKSSN